MGELKPNKVLLVVSFVYIAFAAGMKDVLDAILGIYFLLLSVILSEGNIF